MKVQKLPPDPFTIPEAMAIINEMTGRYHEGIRNYFEFAFFTGLRTLELIELQWSDIEEDLIVVRRARVEDQSKGTKTSQVRNVELNLKAKEAINRQAALTRLAGKHVFLNPITNNPWNDQRSQVRYWKPVLAKLKLHYRKPYQTRHTFATSMLMAGANPMWVSRQLGHTSMKMTLEVYSKWIDQADKSKELDKVNNALFGPVLSQEEKGKVKQL